MKNLVLNLVINGWPSILYVAGKATVDGGVLNLVINGWPSIPKMELNEQLKKIWF